ncbi:MAG: NYN domain-containing protein [Syntrophothermus sp.]
MDKILQSVSVFADVQNIYYTVKQIYKCHFDYKKFMSEVTHERQLVKAIAYAIDKKDEKQIKFQKILEDIGFEIKLKPFIKRNDGSTKGDWDVGITIDILDYVKSSDVIVLASGDGDFDLLAGKITKQYNAAFEVYGVPDLTAASLIEHATKFIPIREDLLFFG